MRDTAIQTNSAVSAIEAEFCERARRCRDLDAIRALLADLPDEIRSMWRRTEFDPAGYTRRVLHRDESVSVLLLGWLPGQASEIHDHGGSACCFRVLRGVAVESRYEIDPQGAALEVSRDAFLTGSVLACDGTDIHSIVNDRAAAEPLVTLHVYRPEPVMRYYKAAAGKGVRW